MANTVNERKSEQLGMPLGTAVARLRKGIALDLLRTLEEDWCFGCAGRIETSEDLGYDHKVPWLDVDSALFWEVSNVGFSHRSCNRPEQARWGHRFTGGSSVTSTAQRKAEQLGMPFATASNRLKRLVHFDLVRRAGRNSCFQCDGVISEPTELSTEHKEPWFGRDTALFWDLTNIAFSHATCNRPNGCTGVRNGKAGPPGTAWCVGHQRFLPVSEFYPNPRRWNGLCHHCKACRRVYNARRHRKAEVRA